MCVHKTSHGSQCHGYLTSTLWSFLVLWFFGKFGRMVTSLVLCFFVFFWPSGFSLTSSSTVPRHDRLGHFSKKYILLFYIKWCKPLDSRASGWSWSRELNIQDSSGYCTSILVDSNTSDFQKKYFETYFSHKMSLYAPKFSLCKSLTCLSFPFVN